MDLHHNAHHLCFYYDMGFLYKIPRECIFAYSNQDIHTSSEGIQMVKDIRASIEDLPNAKYTHQELLDMLTPAQRAQYLEDGNSGITELQIRTHKYRPVTNYWTELMTTRPELKDLPQKFKYKWDNFTPQDIVSSIAKREYNYNEVAFVPRVSNPHQEARIVGVYYGSDLKGFGTEKKNSGTKEMKDPLSRDQTIASLKIMAEKMGVPLVELK